MKLTLELSPSEIAYHVSAAPGACAYWQCDASDTEKLPSPRALREKLSRPIVIEAKDVKSGEHYAPVIRARLGRFSDAQSGVYLRALAVARALTVAQGMEPSQAVDLVARHFPERLTALEVAAVAIALVTGTSCAS